jgi:hypothetical protein
MSFKDIYIQRREKAKQEAFDKQKRDIQATDWLLEVLAEVEAIGLRVKIAGTGFKVIAFDHTILCYVKVEVKGCNVYDEYHVTLTEGTRGSNFCFVDSQTDNLKDRIYTQIADFIINREDK